MATASYHGKAAKRNARFGATLRGLQLHFKCCHIFGAILWVLRFECSEFWWMDTISIWVQFWLDLLKYRPIWSKGSPSRVVRSCWEHPQVEFLQCKATNGWEDGLDGINAMFSQRSLWCFLFKVIKDGLQWHGRLHSRAQEEMTDPPATRKKIV